MRTIGGTPYTLGFVYDANGNRTTMTYPSGRIVTYGFDFADRPASAVSGGTSYVSAISPATYAPFGPLATLTYGTTPAMTRTMTYDQRDLPQSLIVTGAAEPISYSYTPDGAGNLTAITDTGNTAYSRTFAYDDLNRLTTANSGGSLWGTGTHSYDPMGNLTSMSLGATSRTFIYQNQTPKLSTVTETGIGVRTVGYDLAGNESVQGGTYGYSPRNLLGTVAGSTGALIRARVGHAAIHQTPADPTTVYTYDGRGLRVKLSQSTDGTAQERSFVYDDAMHLIAETTYQVPPSTAIAYEYFWFAGQPVAQETIGGSTAWTVTDHLGTPFVETNISGTVIWRAEYEPYGEVYSLRSGSDRHQPLRLPGQEAEQLDLGLNGDSERSYNIFRWYRPKWGRYTQADPIGLEGGVNLFGYADANSIRFTDPLGLITCRCERHLHGGGRFSDSAGIYHQYMRIGPKPVCQDNPSYGFTHDQGSGLLMVFSYRGRVDLNDPDRTQERCEVVPCTDDAKALDFVQRHRNSPGPYICVGRNCYDLNRAALDFSRIPGCCASTPGNTGGRQ